MAVVDGTILKIVASMLFTDGNVAQNVFAAVVAGGGAPWDPEDIVDDAVAWMDLIYGHLTSTVTDTLDGVEVIVYEYDAVDDDFDEVGTGSWTWNPIVATDPLPRGVAALINARTLNPDVSGKKYIPGIPEGNLTNAVWVAATLTTLANLADQWVNIFTGATSGAGWVPGIWSPTRSAFYAFSLTHDEPAEPSYQRRRKRGVGA